MTIACSERTISTVGTELVVTEGGSGKPLLVLHEELGDSGWLKWKQELAKTRTVITPQHPGFGVSPRIAWARSIGDLANFYAQVMVEQGWVGADVIGFSLGGLMPIGATRVRVANWPGFWAAISAATQPW